MQLKHTEFFEETPLYMAVLTYIGYGILIIFGHFRDLLCRWNLEKVSMNTEYLTTVSNNCCQTLIILLSVSNFNSVFVFTVRCSLPAVLFIIHYDISTAEDTSSLSGFLQILQEKQKTDYFYKYRTGLNNFGI